LIEFDQKFQELVEWSKELLFALGGLNQLQKEIWNFNFVCFLDLLPEFDSNLFEFVFGLFRVGLYHWISA
jgi:hypothetical protein